MTNANFLRSQKTIVNLAMKNRLASMFEGHTWVEAGGLMSYSTDDLAVFRRAAVYVDKILKGIKPADLPRSTSKPIIHGCFHSESTGDLISTLIADAKNHQFMKAFLDIFAQHTGIDLRIYKRSKTAKTLWEETLEIQRLRNQVLHRGSDVPETEAVRGIEVASCLLTFVFPHAMTKLLPSSIE